MTGVAELSRWVGARQVSKASEQRGPVFPTKKEAEEIKSQMLVAHSETGWEGSRLDNSVELLM